MNSTLRSYAQHIVYLLRPFVRPLLSSFDVHRTTPWGTRMVLDLSKDVDFDVFMGNFEVHHLSVFSAVIRPGDTIIDVGANIGIYSMIAAARAGASGHIYSFEPSQWAQSRLRRNIQLNHATMVEVVPSGVSHASGTIPFYVCEDDAYNSIGKVPMKPVIRTESIEVVTLDGFCASRGVTNVDILKIDTEGADFLVLKGAQHLLRSAQAPLLFCEVNRNIKEGFSYSMDEYLSFLRECGYEVFEISVGGGTLTPFQLETSRSNEVVCLKPYHKERIGAMIHIGT